MSVKVDAGAIVQQFVVSVRAVVQFESATQIVDFGCIDETIDAPGTIQLVEKLHIVVVKAFQFGFGFCSQKLSDHAVVFRRQVSDGTRSAGNIKGKRFQCVVAFPGGGIY